MTEIDTLPADVEAESATLGAAMYSPASASTVVEQLKPDDFYRPAHALVFEAIAGLVDDGQAVDVMTVKAAVERRRAKGEITDSSILVGMMEAAPVASQVGHYIRRVKEKAYRRRVVLGGIRLETLGRNVALDHDALAGEIARVIDEVAEVEQQPTAMTVSESIYKYLDALASKAPDRGVTTGWTDLDAVLTKLRPGQMVTIGARPGMGKTVVIVNLALHVGVRLGLPVLLASLEMSRNEIVARMVAATSKVSLSALNAETISEAEWRRIADKTDALVKAEHLLIDDDPNLSVSRLRSRLTSMRRAGTPAALVLLDYLQLMTAGRKPESRQQEVSAISRALKLLAKEFEVPIVVGSQLNRGPEQRTGKRPMLADLRESGSVEQDSDVVILLHREDAYDPESSRAGEIDLIVAKHRQGPTATITAAFQGRYSKIADMAADRPPPRRGHLAAASI